MELIGRNGESFSLVPIAYEFPDNVDLDWLVVRGEVSTGGRSWSSRSAALTTSESRQLGMWLLSVARETEPVAGSKDKPMLTFEEPSLAFSVVGYAADAVRLRVYLSHGCAAPWLDIDDQLRTYENFIELELPTIEVEGAARVWLDELRAFPLR